MSLINRALLEHPVSNLWRLTLLAAIGLIAVSLFTHTFKSLES